MIHKKKVGQKIILKVRNPIYSALVILFLCIAISVLLNKSKIPVFDFSWSVLGLFVGIVVSGFFYWQSAIAITLDWQNRTIGWDQGQCCFDEIQKIILDSVTIGRLNNQYNQYRLVFCLKNATFKSSGLEKEILMASFGVPALYRQLKKELSLKSFNIIPFEKRDSRTFRGGWIIIAIAVIFFISYVLFNLINADFFSTFH